MHPENLSEVLRKHPFVSNLSEEYIQTLVGCASNVHFTEGTYIFREGEAAAQFYLVRSGRIALEVYAGAKGSRRIQTVGAGEVLGWSWLISPYRWHFDGVAVEDVRALALDGKCLRGKCETDHHFGYAMLSHLAGVLERRLEATRLQLLDLYSQ